MSALKARSSHLSSPTGTTPFADKVYTALLRIPAGRVITYSALARRINESHDVCHVERLLRIDGADGFTKAQGED